MENENDIVAVTINALNPPTYEKYDFVKAIISYKQIVKDRIYVVVNRKNFNDGQHIQIVEDQLNNYPSIYFIPGTITEWKKQHYPKFK